MPTIPAPISRLTSFTAVQQAQGDSAFPGTQLDADLDQTNNTLDTLIAAIRLVIRADGVLANGSVSRSALAADVMLGLGMSRPWSSGTTYAKDDTVTRGYGLYVALVASTGADPATNGVAWALQADLSQAVVVADGSIGTSKFPDRAVTEPKLADGVVSTRTLGTGSVTRAKAALDLGIVQVGSELDFAGIILPSGWLRCYGQAVSRSYYADLFSILTAVITGNTVIGSNQITGVNYSFGGDGIEGSQVEGPGIPSGAFVVATDGGTTLTISAAATATSTGAAFRVLPWGRGDGSSTFNVPDRRAIVVAGRDSGSGRLDTSVAASRLNASGGAAQTALVNGNLPATLPGGSVNVTFPSYAGVKYSTLATASGGAGGTNVPNLWQATEPYTTTASAGSGSFPFGIANPGGGQPFATVQPTGVANRIIFAGV